MAVTIGDLSQHLGLSVSTVSKALNGYSDVSERTKARVKVAVQELGYHPSAAARSLRRGRTDKVGLLINNSISYLGDYLSEMMAGAAISAEQNDLNLILYTKTVTEADEIYRICRVREVDGLILIFEPSPEAVAILQKARMPFVVFGRKCANPTISYVSPNNEVGAYELTRHLIAQGHQKIAFTTRPQLGNLNQERFGGYKRAMCEADLPVEPQYIVETRIEPFSGYHAMHKLLDLPTPPTALFAFYDLMAVDASKAAQERGYRVPNDIAIAGFDGLRSSLITNPAITTVRQPLKRMGTRAIQLLANQIEARPPAHIIYPAELIIRDSTTAV